MFKDFNRENIKKSIRFIFIAGTAFLVGFIGSMLYITRTNKQITENLVNNVENLSNHVETVKIFGISIIQFVFENKGVDGYEITIIENDLYNFVPFICGALLCIFVVAFSYSVSFLLKRMMEKRRTI